MWVRPLLQTKNEIPKNHYAKSLPPKAHQKCFIQVCRCFSFFFLNRELFPEKKQKKTCRVCRPTGFSDSAHGSHSAEPPPGHLLRPGLRRYGGRQQGRRRHHRRAHGVLLPGFRHEGRVGNGGNVWMERCFKHVWRFELMLLFASLLVFLSFREEPGLEVWNNDAFLRGTWCSSRYSDCNFSYLQLTIFRLCVLNVLGLFGFVFEIS